MRAPFWLVTYDGYSRSYTDRRLAYSWYHWIKAKPWGAGATIELRTYTKKED